MLFSLSFNGNKEDYLICERGKRRSAFAPIKRILLAIPGMPGAYLESTDTEVRIIEQPIIIKADDRIGQRILEEDLAAWLITKEPAPLIFEEEPKRVYYAVVDGSLNIDDIAKFGKGTITFICLDPRKYSSTLKQPTYSYLQDDFNNPIVFDVGGTTDTAPIITVTLKEATTYLDIIGEKDYMRIGQPTAIDTTPKPEKEIVFLDGLETTVGWANAQNMDIDGGVVSGTMLSNNYQFYSSDYGTGSDWHGPAKIKSIGQSLTDFEAEITLTLRNEDFKKHGRVEIYLLDSNKQAVCKLALKDISQGQDGNYAELRVGDNVNNHFIINERGNSWQSWVDFEGILRISRVGNKWTAYVAKFDANKNHINTRLVEWTDVANLYTRKPANVVVHVGAHGTIATNTMSMSEVKVSKINTLTDAQVPYIGVSGDVFVFDHKAEKITKNGELFTKKDFGARFFKFEKGYPSYLFSPSESIAEVKTEWRDAYL